MDFTIIVTVGPSILSKIDKLLEIQHAGPCIFRLNGAHCSPEQLKIYNKVIRSVIPQARMMIDLPGNKIRTANLPNKIQFMRGETITLWDTNFNYTGFPAMVKPGDEILANDSNLCFIVEKADDKSMLLRAEHSGELISGKGMHIPGITIKLPFLFQADIDLINAAAEANLDYISLSYVRNAEDITQVKKLLAELNYAPEFIAKIETSSALKNLDEILDEIEIVNIDRGDLSSDIGLIRIAQSQSEVITACKTRRKDVFLATQCLKNMETRPIPLIPEIIDLSSSIQQGISGVQLSEETAVGLYPVECIHLVWQVYHHINTQSLNR
ncbi:MAG TPA: pyruvate kinase [Deltaproteobacteria bacterium]|nr:pyruvate kinase [Deltaproteobacteria bacterium]